MTVAYPDGVVMCPCSVGKTVILVSGTDVAIDVTVTPIVIGTSRLTWTADGTGFSLQSVNYSGAPGSIVEFSLPAVDQDGVIDGNGDAFKNWAYKVTWKERGSSSAKTVVFQPLSAQSGGTIDIDLLPDGSASSPITSVIPVVLSVNGHTGTVVLTAADLGVPETGDLATVAFSGLYDDLDGLPTIPNSPDDIGAATEAQGLLAETAIQPADLASLDSGYKGMFLLGGM